MKTINLDFRKLEGMNKAFTSRVADSGDTLKVVLSDGGTPVDLTNFIKVSLKATKPNGVYVFITGNIVGDGVEFIIPSGFNSVAGYFKRAYIEAVTTDNKVVSTQDFLYYSYGDADISGGNAGDYISRVEELIKELNEKVDAMLSETETKVNAALAEVKALQVKVDDIIADLEGYTYSKEQIDTKFSEYYKKTETYNQTEIDNKLATVTVDAYTKSETDTKLTTLSNNIPKVATLTEIETGTASNRFISPYGFNQYNAKNAITLGEWTVLPLASTVKTGNNSTPMYRLLTVTANGVNRYKVFFRGAVMASSTNNVPSSGSSLVINSALPTILRPQSVVMGLGSTNDLSWGGRLAITQDGWFGVGNQSGKTLEYVDISALSYWTD